MAKPGRHDFSNAAAVYQGDKLSAVLSLEDDAGAIVDLSAATFGMMVKTAAGGTLLVDLSSYWAVSTDGLDGSATLTVPGSMLSALAVTGGSPIAEDPPTYRFKYDFQTTIAGDVKTWIWGNFDLIQEVTTP